MLVNVNLTCISIILNISFINSHKLIFYEQICSFLVFSLLPNVLNITLRETQHKANINLQIVLGNHML